jgi:hypothetical protein
MKGGHTTALHVTGKSPAPSTSFDAAIGLDREGAKLSRGSLESVLKLIEERESETENVAAKLLAEARQDPRAVVEFCLSSNQALASAAQNLLLNLEETIIVPAIEAKPVKRDDGVWLAQVAVEAELGLRKRLAAHLKSLLDDKTLLPPRQKGRHVEQSEPPVRVCDQAYLELRRILNLGESRRSQILEAGRYLELTFDERDPHIQRLKRTQQWSNLLEEGEQK